MIGLSLDSNGESGGKREFSFLRRPSSFSFALQAPHAARGRLTSSATSLS
jgi:hypothetical protein